MAYSHGAIFIIAATIFVAMIGLYGIHWKYSHGMVATTTTLNAVKPISSDKYIA